MWTITPLHVGTLSITQGSQICRHGVAADPGKVVSSPCIAWLLRHTETKRVVLVDAGPADDPEWGSKYHNPIIKSPEMSLVNRLAEQGLRPEDIDTVILTHLHWDHAYGVLHLPNAKVYVQKSEMRYSVTPMRTDFKHYEVNVKSQIPFFLNFYNQIQMIDGDVTFDDGLEIITLPGHSPGSQGVVVTTEQGKFIIAGDLINVTENWTARIPTGIYGSMSDCLNSLDKMESYDATVLPSHDFAAFQMLGVACPPTA